MLDVESLTWLWVLGDGRITEDERSGESPLWRPAGSPSILVMSTAECEADIRGVWSAAIDAFTRTEPFIDGAVPSPSAGRFMEAARAILQDRAGQ